MARQSTRQKQQRQLAVLGAALTAAAATSSVSAQSNSTSTSGSGSKLANTFQVVGESGVSAQQLFRGQGNKVSNGPRAMME